MGSRKGGVWSRPCRQRAEMTRASWAWEYGGCPTCKEQGSLAVGTLRLTGRGVLVVGE